jgi:hypothetical protein
VHMYPEAHMPPSRIHVEYVGPAGVVVVIVT